MDANKLTEGQRTEIRARKRAVWSQKGAGDEYFHLAHRNEPVIRLKNLTEVGFVLRYVAGPRILDAGAGTGRFTFPLRDRDYTTLALDISREMLRRGRLHAASTGKELPCVQGEIEGLPFSDEVFDSVVSMTVVRHFPDWKPVLDEYLRVTREGGRVIFDMAAGEQQEFGDSMGMPRPYVREGELSPLDFDTGVTLREMSEYAKERHCCIAAYQAHDFFNNNHLLRHVLGSDYERIADTVREHLTHDDVLRFCEMVHRRFLPVLSPAVSSSVLIVLEKRPGDDVEPQQETSTDLQSADEPEAILLDTLKHGLGRRYGSFMREASRHMDSPEVREFVAFCKSSLLPRLPRTCYQLRHS